MPPPCCEANHQVVDRRTALKRLGTGAAMAWSAPVLLTLRTPAYAASPECPECRPFDCDPSFPGCRGGECLCFETIEGDCFCAGTTLCGPCKKSSDCAPDDRCVVIACADPCHAPGTFCAKPCPF